ncbi:enoyl-CoA-hydratase DpgB [Sorangium sp. So ce1128]|uniref:Enoyl-CoA hydratase n=1 Tax=Sorangium cellulosum TaxID=56 RepID=A0A3S7UZU1_SORCE|nr:hypothetical protein [Sorangium cellulosum]
MNADHDPGALAARLPLRLDIDGGVPLAELTAAVNGVCQQAEDRTHSVVVLWLPTSSFDPKGWPGEISIQDANRWERAVRRLERLAAASIAVVSGACGGPALDLLLATDYRIATAELRLLLPVNDGHVWPGMAVHRLVNQVGVARARQLLVGGHDISAQQALDIGLVDELSSAASDALRAAASRLGRISGKELAIRRQLVLEAPATSFEDALGTHLAACDRELRRLHGRGEPDEERSARTGDR